MSRSFLRRQRQQVDAVEADGAADDPPRFGHELQQRVHADALARAGLADEAEHLAPPDGQVDAVDRLHDAVTGEEPRPQPADLEQRRLARVGVPSPVRRDRPGVVATGNDGPLIC